MRIRVYVNGKPDWSENVPSSGAEFGFHLGGGPITPAGPISRKGEPGSIDAQRHRIARLAKRAGEAQKEPQT